MSNDINNIYTQKEEELDINNDYYGADEMNFQNASVDDKNESYDDNIDLMEENESIDEKEKKYIIDEIKNDIDKEINNQIILERITEEDNNNNNKNINEQDDELPLITLNFISICQCCKNKFDSINNLPYLLKCGHFFCINCIKQYFTDETGIVCPSDGLVAKSIKELKLLKNLIIDSKKINDIQKNTNIYKKKDFTNTNSDTQIILNNNYIINYCPIHKDQKLSHVVNDTNEIICVHCAFEKLKANSNLQIKEIKEKYNEFNDIIDNIINNSQKNIELIQHTLELINKNKENELKKLNIFFNNIIKFIEMKKNEKIQLINNIYKENTHGLEQKLLVFKEIIEQGEVFQKNIEKEEGDISQNYLNILNNYNNILKLNKSSNDDTINNKLKYIKFSNENEKTIKDFLNKISNLNIIYRIIKYNKDGKDALKDNNKHKIKKANNELYDKNISSSIQIHNKNNESRKKINNNIKNISFDHLYVNNINSLQNDKFMNKNSSMNMKDTNYFIQNTLNQNYTKIRNKTNKSTKIPNNINKTPFIKNTFEEKYHNKRSIRSNKTHINNNSLLESYFELKDKEKCMSLNNYDSFTIMEKRVESQKNSKSFNNLNILNNFYNLDYSKRSPNNNIRKKNLIHHYNTNKNIENRKIKINNDSVNLLLPETLKQFNSIYK